MSKRTRQVLETDAGTATSLWHQPGVVAKRMKFATEMMRPGASLHADEAWRQVGKPRFHLATRPLLAQHQGSTPILA